MANFVGSEAAVSGTADDDIMVVAGAVPGQSYERFGGGGGDVMVGASQKAVVVDAVAGNGGMATARNIDAADFWSTSGSPIVFDSAVPHALIVGTGAGAKDYFSVTVAAGETITLDLDMAAKTYARPAGGPSFIPRLQLFDADGTLVAFDESQHYPLDTGSTNINDRHFSYVAETGGTYYFAVTENNYEAIAPGGTYLLNVSVTGHAANTVAIGGVTLHGDEGHDFLYGGAGDDRLDGGEGQDWMYGGLGDDSYWVTSYGDDIREYAGEGTDTVYQLEGYYPLQDNIENLVLVGSLGQTAIGNDLDNHITGNDAGNLIDAKKGADIMEGMGGDDIYVIDNAGDRVIEQADAGIDLIQSIYSQVMSANVENLELLGHGNLRGVGNDLANRITGTTGDNVLDGKKGADWMAGGLGNDSYHIDNVGDVAVEEADAGTDTLTSVYSWTLGAHVENLVLQGGGNLRGFGNDLNNRLTGNDGNNVLDGKKGADWMAGGLGDDSYYIDDVGDVVVEAAGAGVDTVHSVYSWTLGANVENLVLRGGGNLRGIGNDLANAISGNDGNNDLYGGLGADVLTGGAGADRFIFDTAPGGGNVDMITDFVVGQDRIVLDDAIFGGAGVPGTMRAGQFREGAAAADHSDRIVYNSATGDLFYDADGDGAGAAVLFARLQPGLALSHADFVIV
jgi:Ca2+-binding RTX toxin-like protein